MKLGLDVLGLLLAIEEKHGVESDELLQEDYHVVVQKEEVEE
ncbi:MAG: hypothetical protein ABSG25_14285 [Bryobacteraceae bacterium]